MAIVAIDTQQDANYTMRSVLDEETFVFTFRFNSRDQRWYFDLADVNEVPIITGRKVITNYGLLRLVTNLARPQGDIAAVNTTPAETEAGLEDLGIGRAVTLTYTEIADLL